MAECFETADTREASKSNSMYYELLCDNAQSDYWLASRSVNTVETWGADFCLRLVYDGGIAAKNVIYSSGHVVDNHLDHYVRPVVSIPASIIDISTEYNPSTGWSIK